MTIRSDPKMSGFRTELQRLINYYSLENGCDTPDFILAEFMCKALSLFDDTVNAREKWHGVLIPRAREIPIRSEDIIYAHPGKPMV